MTLEEIFATEYNEPDNKDMVVVLAYFSPAEFHKPVENFERTVKKLKDANIPVFRIGLWYDHNTYDCPFPEVDYMVRGKHCMFHKENLYNIAIKKLDGAYKKICFMDGDLVFSDPDWYAKTSDLLDHNDAVQPMEFCRWEGWECIKKSAAVVIHRSDRDDMSVYHPGFSWAFHVSYLQKTGLFLDKVISGAGDSVLANMLSKDKMWLTPEWVHRFTGIQSSIEEMWRIQEKCDNPATSVSYVPGCYVGHMYHGSRFNRKYIDRHKVFADYPDIGYIYNQHGVLEFTIEGPHQFLLNFLTSRNEDESIEDAYRSNLPGYFRVLADETEHRSILHGRNGIPSKEWWNDKAWCFINKGLIIRYLLTIKTKFKSKEFIRDILRHLDYDKPKHV